MTRARPAAEAVEQLRAVQLAQSAGSARSALGRRPPAPVIVRRHRLSVIPARAACTGGCRSRDCRRARRPGPRPAPAGRARHRRCAAGRARRARSRAAVEQLGRERRHGLARGVGDRAQPAGDARLRPAVQVAQRAARHLGGVVLQLAGVEFVGARADPLAGARAGPSCQLRSSKSSSDVVRSRRRRAALGRQPQRHRFADRQRVAAAHDDDVAQRVFERTGLGRVAGDRADQHRAQEPARTVDADEAHRGGPAVDLQRADQLGAERPVRRGP